MAKKPKVWIDAEYIEKARDELKRVDHLIFVSLKYTRTVDVIRSVIQRMIDSLDFVVDGLLEKLKEAKKIDSIPQAPGLKCNVIKKNMKDEKILEIIEFYQRFRKIMLAKFTISTEFRRHVHMIAAVDDGVRVDIDTVVEYYKTLKEYMDYIEGK